MTEFLNSIGIDLRCKRQFGRAALGVSAKLSLVDGEYGCDLIDISLEGAQIVCERAPKLGTMVVLKVGGAELFGSVVWGAQDAIGIRFDERAPKELIVHLSALASSRMGYDGYESRIAANNWANGT